MKIFHENLAKIFRVLHTSLVLTLAIPHRLDQHDVVAAGLYQQDGLVGVPENIS